MNDQKNFKINIDGKSAIDTSENLNAQLKEMQKELAEMVVQGKEGTKEFEELSQKAGQLKDAIGDAQQHIKRMADDTRTMNDVLDVTKSTISVFGIMQSAVSALGVEDEKLIKTIKTLQTTQTALSSVQQLQATLMNKSSATYKLLNANIVTYTGTSKAAAVATKALNMALKGLGIGLIVGAIAAIASHMDEIKENLSGILPFLKDNTKELEKQNELAKERAETEKRRADIERELNILRGESLEVYEKEMTAAKNREAALKKTYEAASKAYEDAARKGNRTASKEASLEEKRDKAREAYQKAQIETIKIEKLYNDELERRNKLEFDEGFKVWEAAQKKKMTDLEAEKTLREAINKSSREGIEAELDAMKKRVGPVEFSVTAEEPEDTSWIKWTKEQLISVKEEMGKLPDELQKMLDEMEKAEEEAEEKRQQRIETFQQYLSSTSELASSVIDAVASGIDSNIKLIEKALSRVDKALDKTEKSISNHKDNLSGLYAELAESEGANRDALLESIEIERAAMNEQFEEQKRLEAERAAQEKQLEKEKAKKERLNLANQLVMSIANTAMSISSTSAQMGYPAAIPFVAMAAASGAIQTALIASQMGKLKYEKGGLLNGKSHKDGGMRVEGTNIEVEGGEYVVNKKATRRYLPLLEAINGTTKFANGGEINLPSSDNLMNYTNFEFSPVVSVTDINKANTRLNKVRVR